MQLVSWWLWIAVAVAAVQWNPAGIADHGTIEFLTVAPDEGEHWSTVWFVVIDGNIYLRLGPRAAARIEKNSTAPRLKLRVSGKEVPQKLPALHRAIGSSSYSGPAASSASLRLRSNASRSVVRSVSNSSSLAACRP